MRLEQLGWDDTFAKAFTEYQAAGYSPARVAIQYSNRYVVMNPMGEHDAYPSGTLTHSAATATELPAVGDWVALEHGNGESPATIHAVLPRRSRFSRNAAGANSAEQIVAANVDVLFLVSSLNTELNLRRLERYLALAWESGATPVIVLNKADLADDPEGEAARVADIAWGTPIHIVSAMEASGIEEVAAHMAEGRTAAVVGSSGVGKSTLINAIAGEDVMVTSGISSYKDRGRHTTTHRQLLALQRGGIIIDTPGMRELQLWEGGEGLRKTFADIEQLLGACRFVNCTHATEPGCAIQDAIEHGTLDAARFAGYQKLEREIARHEQRRKQIDDRKTRSAGKKRYDKSERRTRWGE